MEIFNILITGDQFTNASNTVLTYKEYNDFYNKTMEAQSPQDKIRLILGQGLTTSQYDTIHKQVENNPVFELLNPGKHLAYKNRIKNTIISEPSKTDSNTYHCYLLLDNSFDAIDLKPAPHISNMILKESAIQMAKYVSDNFFISSENRQQKTCKLNQINASFDALVYPWEVEMILKIEGYRDSLYENFNIKARIDFIQDKEIKTTVSIDLSQMETRYISDIESNMAKTAIDKLWAQINHTN